MAVRRVLGSWAIVALAASSGRTLEAQEGRATPPTRLSVQAVSLLGDSLRTLPLSSPVRARYEAQLSDARQAYGRAPTNVDSIIWFARRLGYIGYLRESIEIYTRGIALYPTNPWLYRHRGHRWISVRDFPSAVRDLALAASLTDGKPDEVEPDGQPNAANTPIGTLRSNIGYHLALAYYLQGDFAKAATFARREFDAATNDDRRVSMAHWLYLSLRRSGQDKEAATVLAALRRPLTIVENDAYRKLIQLYQGVLSPDAVLATDAAGALSVQDVSTAYGVAAWYMLSNRPTDAAALWTRIVAAGQWGAFGSIAAEAELARRR